MFEIWRGEYEDTARVKMDGKPMSFNNLAHAELFVTIYNLDRRQDLAWVNDYDEKD